MLAIVRMLYRISVTERILAAAILFYGALLFCLPVPYSEEVANLYPWWGKRIAVGNVQLYELFLIGWLLLYGRGFIQRTLLNGGIPTRQAAIWLIGLALWCGVISFSAPLLWQDLGRTFRLLLNAALLLAVVRWTWQLGNFPLKVLVLGFFVGTIINLVISFQYPFIVNGTMRLSGQNTPGVAMGIAIHLAAWLFLRAGSLKNQFLVFCSALVFAFACAISYSRIGWIAGGLGLVAWAYILLLARPVDRLQYLRIKRMRRVLLPLFFIFLVLAPIVTPVQKGFLWVQALVEQKVSRQVESNDIRWAYLTGSAEIVWRYPLGVGYSGFYDAMTATDTYRFGNAAEEESPADANPHATFLWYTTAGGVPGGVIAVMLFTMLLNSMRFGLVSAMGKSGFVLFILAAIPFLVTGLTVPYLFNSIIFIVPTAIAAGWGWRSKWDRQNIRFPNNETFHAKKTLRLPE